MLVAKTKCGKMISLGNFSEKETLKKLRQSEEFFCPVCEEKVVLKLGDRRIYHFSHLKGGNCREFYENESEYHLQGKLKLYQWLKKQEIPAVLEFYDREIQQRPDIVFTYEGRKYALEFQCSTISEELFRQRTKSYFAHGYTPLWILGGKSIKENYKDSTGLTGFQYLFLRSSKDGKLFIPTFSPDMNSLSILHSIYPYSTKKVICQKVSARLEKLKLRSLIEPQFTVKLSIDQWRKASDQYKRHWSLYHSEQQMKFFTEVYTRHLNLFLLPSEIGLPVPHGLLIQSPPFIWQAYYYLDLLHNKFPGDLISGQQIAQNFTKRVNEKNIILRNFPQIEKINPILAYIDYTLLLERLGVIERIKKDLFQVKHPLTIPETNREKEEQAIQFFKKNPQIFEKNK